MRILLLWYTLILAPSAPTDLRAVQNNATSVQVSWTPSENVDGYRIDYSNSDSSGSVNVSSGSTDNYLLTGLQNGERYTISIVATLQFFPSESVEVTIGLGTYVRVGVNQNKSDICTSTCMYMF